MIDIYNLFFKKQMLNSIKLNKLSKFITNIELLKSFNSMIIDYNKINDFVPDKNVWNVSTLRLRSEL